MLLKTSSCASIERGHSVRPNLSLKRGKEANWIASVPNKGWFAILRLYGPLEPWFNKAWRPGEIEEVK
jgi:hypothetical protein